MTRKVRLTDYNQRIEVPQGAALFLEGGDIVVDGEIGSEGDSLGIVGGKPGYAPGGGGGGFSPTITDPQDGDSIARVGGVWVNSASGAFLDANLVGGDVGDANSFPYVPAVTVGAASGISVGEDGHTITFAQSGRYLFEIVAAIRWLTPAADYASVDFACRHDGGTDFPTAPSMSVPMPPTTLLAMYLPPLVRWADADAGTQCHIWVYNNDSGSDLYFDGAQLRICRVGPATSL